MLALFALGTADAQADGPVALKGLTDNSLESVTAGELPARIADFKALGVTWVRYELDWSVIQPSGPDRYELDQQDRVIKALTEAGISVLGLVDYTPGWANGGAPSKYTPPRDNAAFAAFARYIVARYAPMGVHSWEVWNEENTASFWLPAANVADYAALLKVTSTAIHAADPEATVMFGGLAQPGDGDGNISALHFLEGLYEAGAQQSFDAVADHPYFSPNFPTNTDGNNWQKMFNTVPSFRSIMTRHGDGSKMLWVTEVGAPTDGKDEYGTVIPEIAQALMISQMFRFAAEPRYSWLGPVFWYNYRDFPVPADPVPSSECCFGLRRADGSAKPSYDSYRAAPGFRASSQVR